MGGGNGLGVFYIVLRGTVKNDGEPPVEAKNSGRAVEL